MPRTTGLHRLHLLALFLPVVLCQAMRALADDVNVVERFKIEKDGNTLLVPVTVSGKEYLFLVDTGATVTTFDRTLLPGKPTGETIVHGAEGDRALPRYDAPEALLGHQDLKEQL